MPLRYSKRFLLRSVRNFAISRILRRRLFYFGILSYTAQATAPASIQVSADAPAERQIPVRITVRRHRVLSSDKPAHRVLCHIPRAPRHLHRRTSLSCGLLNVRSLHHKVDDVFDIQRQHSLDVFLLTETWHDSDSVSISRLRRAGFSVADQPRPRLRTDNLHTNHGGVAIISKPCVRQTRLGSSFSPTTFEAVCVRLHSGSTSAVVILIYRTGPVTCSFFDELSHLLDETAVQSCPVIIAGDLNIHVEKPDNPHAKSLCELLSAYGFTLRVDTPTHDLGGTLDVVFTRSDLPDIVVAASDPGVSDHCLLTWSFPFSPSPPVYVSLTRRPWSRLDLLEFRRELSGSTICLPHTWKDRSADELASAFDVCIVSVLDLLIPLRTITLRRRPSDPWFDDVCREAKRRVRRLERLLTRLQGHLSLDIEALNTARTKWKHSLITYRSLLRRKRERFWCEKVDSERCSPRELWRSFDSLMGRGRSPPSTWLTAFDFHEHFQQKVAGIREASATAPPPSFSAAPLNCRFAAFLSISEQSVLKAINRLPKKSSASDPFQISILKACADLLTPFITHLFNLSLSTGVFPRQWKHAVITPVPKKGQNDPLEVKSYRPISNLAVLSKLLERLVSSQIRDHLLTHSLLPSLQSAYRPHHSTETALLKISSDLLLSMDSGRLCLLCLIDLSSAFDTVDHRTLLTRLQTSFGFTDTVLKWLHSFLNDRCQSIRHAGQFSETSAASSGVPQGSVLGPLLFVLYISDIINIVQSHGLHVHVYADDVQIYGFCTPALKDDLSSQMSACLDSLSAWFAANRLQLNVEKTEFMWCAGKSRLKKLSFEPVRFGSQRPPPSLRVKCLGVFLDSSLTFTSQISSTVAACFSVLRRIRSVRRSLSRPLLTILVQSLVLSRLDYCVSILSGLPSSQLTRLQSVLHASARTIFHSSRFSPVTPLLRQLRWLPVQARIKYRLAVLAHRCHLGTAPAYLSEALRPSSSVRGRSRLRSSRSSSLIVPFVRRCTIGERSFPVAAAKLWNTLPINIANETCHETFKRLLKEHFLSIYF